MTEPTKYESTETTQNFLIDAEIKTYEDIAIVFTQMMKRDNTKGKLIALGKKMTNIGLRLSLFAPDNVVDQYFKWRAVAAEGSNPQSSINEFAKLLFLIRKQIFPNTTFGIENILDSLG